MLTSELSTYVLKIPNNAYTTLSQNLIGCSTLSHEYCKADWMTLKNNAKETLNMETPYYKYMYILCILLDKVYYNFVSYKVDKSDC